jgi:hypothetical protein
LSPPEGQFCAAYANIAGHLAQAYLCQGRAEEAKTCFYTAIEFETIRQGSEWPGTETSLKLLYGLAVAYQKSGDLENAAEVLGSALSLSEKLFGEMDARTAAISSRLKAISGRREVMLEHHKAVVVGATGSKTQQAIQAQEHALDHFSLRAFKDPDDEAEMRHKSEAEGEVEYNSQLHGASFEGDEGVVKLLLGLGNVEADSKGIDERTPLSWAAEKGHEAVAKLLLEKAVDVNSKSKYGRTPLSWAAFNGHEAVVKLLLEKDAELETKDSNIDRTPLSWAAGNGYEAVVKLLLEKSAELETKDEINRTPLSWAAFNGHEAVVKLLLEKGAELPRAFLATQGFSSPRDGH